MQRGIAEIGMRWILLCLMCFNAIYFGWQFYVAPARAPMSAPNQESVEPIAAGRIVLLKEVLVAAGSAEPPPSINPSIRQAQVAGSGSPVETGEFVAVHSKLGGDVGSQIAAVDAAEIDSGHDLDHSVSDSGGGVDVETAKPPPLLCARLGPYEDEVVARELVSSLQDRGLQPSLSLEEAVYDTDNWVIIPPLASRPEALRLLRRLQGNQIDSYLITEGEFANGISLGLFKQLGSAQGVLAAMKSAGYEAEIHPIERSRSQFWVGFSAELESSNLGAMLTQLIDDSEKLNFSETLCEMFASTP